MACRRKSGQSASAASGDGRPLPDERAVLRSLKRIGAVGDLTLDAAALGRVVSLAGRWSRSRHPQGVDRTLPARPQVAPVRDGTRRHQRAGVGDGRLREAGFEPDVRFTTTDLQIHLRLVQAGLAAALLPDLVGARDRHDVLAHRLRGRPTRQIFTTVRRGAARHPGVHALTAALQPQ